MKKKLLECTRLSLCTALLFAAAGCGGADAGDASIGGDPSDEGGGLPDPGWGSAGGALEDGGPDDDAGSAPGPDPSAAPDAAPAPEPSPDPDPGPDPGPTPAPDPNQPNPQFEVEMVYTTANIGRTYGTQADVQKVFDKVEGVIGGKSGPKLIGWQEIGESDPCGDSCEISSLKTAFAASAGWETVRPKSVHTPITSNGANDTIHTHATFASPGWAGVSPTRYVVVSFHAIRNLSTINTHFIAGAWSCKSEVAKRKEYWKQAWQVLKAEVATEIDKGRNVVVTGDLNRPRGANSCNPAWDPTSLHPRASDVGGSNIDYVFAVPAIGYDFVIAKQANGSPKKGSIDLGIDGHKAHWVVGSFRSK